MDRFGADFDAYGDDDGFDDRGNPGQHDDGAHSNPPPSPVGQDERRMQVRAYNHWASLLGEATLPHIEDLEPEFLGDFGPYSVLLDFSTGSTSPTIQFVGTELRDECRVQDLVETLEDIPDNSLLAKVADNYMRVISAQGPVNFEAEAVNAKGRRIAYRGILLPYSSDYDTIDFVYAVVNWKEVADAATADALLSEIDAALATQDEPAYEEHTAQEPADMANIVHFDRRLETVRDEFAKRLQRIRNGEAQTESPREQATQENAAPEQAPYEQASQEQVTQQNTPQADAPQYAAPQYEAPQADKSEDNVLAMKGNLNPAPYGAEESYGVEDESVELPAPSFGQTEYANEEETGYDAGYDAGYEQEETGESQDYAAYEPSYTDAVSTPKRNRSVDALGNPIGGAPQDEGGEEPAPSAMSITEEYGLPEWDEEEEPEEDVDGLVNPLADIDLNSRLLSLVNSSVRGKSPIDLGSLADEDEETAEEETEERPLFRPKAPSVDTLLTPQAYDEAEEEDEYGEEYEYDNGGAYSYAPEPVTDSQNAPAHEAAGDAPLEYTAYAAPEEAAEEPAAYSAPYELSEEAVSNEEPASAPAETSYHAPSEEEPVAYEQQPASYESETAEDEPLSLAGYAELPEAEEPQMAAEPLELSEDLIVEEVAPQEAAYESHANDDAAAAEQQAAYAATAHTDIVAEEPAKHPEPESLHGLLAAVHDLTEAARTTQDRSRRALYEAVGRAFDVSIKAVIAAEANGQEQRRVLAQLPVGDLAAEGPETALVMVRRTADGGAEVIGEVPHDTGLLETAAMKLAGR
ncbi:MAG: hypothetical protein CL574_03355 [Altererythrobacter sp.]|nr:hypothetical protein [Altererythrobacter sp.]